MNNIYFLEILLKEAARRSGTSVMLEGEIELLMTELEEVLNKVGLSVFIIAKQIEEITDDNGDEEGTSGTGGSGTDTKLH